MKSSAMPLVPAFTPRQPSVSKSDQIPEKCASTNSEDDDSIAKTTSGSTPHVEKETPTRISSRE